MLAVYSRKIIKRGWVLNALEGLGCHWLSLIGQIVSLKIHSFMIEVHLYP